VLGLWPVVAAECRSVWADSADTFISYTRQPSQTFCDFYPLVRVRIYGKVRIGVRYRGQMSAMVIFWETGVRWGGQMSCIQRAMHETGAGKTHRRPTESRSFTGLGRPRLACYSGKRSNAGRPASASKPDADVKQMQCTGLNINSNSNNQSISGPYSLRATSTTLLFVFFPVPRLRRKYDDVRNLLLQRRHLEITKIAKDCQGFNSVLNCPRIRNIIKQGSCRSQTPPSPLSGHLGSYFKHTSFFLVAICEDPRYVTSG